MNRLYDTKLDNTKWDVTELDNKNYHSYKLNDKTTGDVYFFNYINCFNLLKYKKYKPI